MALREFKIVVTSHDDREHKRKYWADESLIAKEIALSEAYPFGIKQVFCADIPNGSGCVFENGNRFDYVLEFGEV